MNGSAALLAEPWVQQLGWVLINFLWQGAGIAMLLAVVLPLLTQASSEVRYLTIGFAFLACAVAPALTWTALSPPTLRPAASLSAFAPTSIANVQTPSANGPHFQPKVPREASGHDEPRWQETLSRVTDASLPYLVTLWFSGVSILTLRLTLGWTFIRRLCRSASPIQDSRCLERFHGLLGRMKIGVTVRLLQSAVVEVPLLIGWLRPTILIPASVFTGLTPDQLEAILAHELAHVRRYDYLVNLLQTVVETVLFYHPAIWWISRKLREERENCCDDVALEVMQDRLVYVSALAKLEEGRALPLAMTASGGSLLQRIRRIAGPRDRKASAWPLGILLIVMIAIVCLSKSEGMGSQAVAQIHPTSIGDREAKQKGIAALVNNRPITWADIATDLVLSEQYRRAKQTDDKLLLKYLVQEAIDSELVMLAAEASGYRVPQSDLDERVNYGVKGFGGNKDAFAKNLKENGSSMEQFIEQNRRLETYEQMFILNVDGPTKKYLHDHPPSLTTTVSPEVAKKEENALYQKVSTKLENDWISGLRTRAVIQTFEEPTPPNAETATPSLPAPLTPGQDGNVDSSAEAAHIQVLAIDLPESDYQADRQKIDEMVRHGYWTTLLHLPHAREIARSALGKTTFGHGAGLMTGPSNPSLTFEVTPTREQDKIKIIGSVDINHQHWSREPGKVPSLTLKSIASFPLDSTLTPQQLQVVPAEGILEPAAASPSHDSPPHRLFLFFTAWAEPGPSEPASNDADKSPTTSATSTQVPENTRPPRISDAEMKAVEDSQTPLMKALHGRLYDQARTLLAKGADCNATDKMGGNALGFLIADSGSEERFPIDILQMILARTSDHNPLVPIEFCSPPHSDPLLEVALMNAAYPTGLERMADDRQVVKLLLANGARFAGTSENVQALLQAAALGDLPALQKLVAKGTSLNAADGDGWTPLLVSVAMDDQDLANWLIERGANVSAASRRGAEDPLSFAIAHGDDALVEKLIAKGAKPVLRGGDLWRAVERNDQRIFDDLINAGADPKQEPRAYGGDQGKSWRQIDSDPLFKCIDRGQTAMGLTLIAKGVDPEPKDVLGNRNFAYWAVYHDRPEILQALLDHGANPLLKDDAGETPLSLAQKSHPDLVPMLQAASKKIAPKSDTSIQPPNATSVDEAAFYQALKRDRTLVADTSVTSSTLTADAQMLLAIQKGDVAALKKVLEHAVAPNTFDPDRFYSCPIYWAVHFNQPEILKLLLEHFATGDLGPANETPVQLAQKTHPDLVPIIEEGIRRNRGLLSARLTEKLHSVHIDLPAFSGAPLNQVTKFLLDDATAKAGYLDRRVNIGTMDLPPSTTITSPARPNIPIWDALQTIADANKLRFDVDGSWPGNITLYPPKDEAVIHPPADKADKSPAPETSDTTNTQPFITYAPNGSAISVKGDEAKRLQTLQEAYIIREVAHLKSSLNLTPHQEAVVKTIMEKVAQAGSTATPITKTVDQALQEILNPQQEKAWEKLKEDAPKVQAELTAISETNAATDLLHLDDVQKDKVLSVLERIESDSQARIRNVHAPSELSSYLEWRVQAREIAMATILTSDQFAIFSQDLQNDLHAQELALNLIPAPSPALQFGLPRAPMTSSLGDQASLSYSINH